ncbi:MAG TPA: ABC transporter permease [Candidatus Binatia bacterium]|jgi:peptide/nickel transport system permease protein
MSNPRINAQSVANGFGRLGEVWRRLIRLALRNPLGAFGLLLVCLQLLAAGLAPLIAPYDPYEQHYDRIMVRPNLEHLFGTDNFGRDLFSRVMWGAQISIKVGVVAISIGTLLGTILGLISGYMGGKVDMVSQRIMDGWMAFPSIILALAIVAVLGPGEINVMVAIGLSQVPPANRVIRGAVLAEKSNLYVEATRAISASETRIMFRHILPNVAAPIIVVATIALGQAILSEAALSFLGVGVQPPNPAWGSMLSGHSRTYMLVAPWMAVFPGLAIFLTVMGWNLLGDALRDVWDPRLRAAV